MEIYIYQSAQHMWRRSLKSMLASNTIHNDLLDTMLQICKHEVLKEIKSLNSIAAETGKLQTRLIMTKWLLLFVFNGYIFERSWPFFKTSGSSADVLACTSLQFIHVE